MLMKTVIKVFSSLHELMIRLSHFEKYPKRLHLGWKINQFCLDKFLKFSYVQKGAIPCEGPESK